MIVSTLRIPSATHAAHKQHTMPELKIKQLRSAIGVIPKQRATLKALGLRRIGHVVVQQDTPQIRGMVKSVSHLVEVQD